MPLLQLPEHAVYRLDNFGERGTDRPVGSPRRRCASGGGASTSRVVPAVEGEGESLAGTHAADQRGAKAEAQGPCELRTLLLPWRVGPSGVG